jgi:hypothetical protein
VDGACINLCLLELLHSEVVWHKDYFLFDKLFKPSGKLHGPIQHLLGLSISLLLAEEVLALFPMVSLEVVAVAVCWLEYCPLSPVPL